MGCINRFHVGLGAARCLHALRDLSSVPSSFDSMWRCPRSISTIMCIHEPACEPADCSGHGDCVEGECRCAGGFWRGPACDILDCGPSNCSLRGVCTDCESLWWAKASNTRVAAHGWLQGKHGPGQYIRGECRLPACQAPRQGLGAPLCAVPAGSRSPFPPWCDGA